MKYFILAGEKSGDLHGSNLIREIKQIDPKAEIKAWGGDGMQAEGAEILIHHKELAIMGLLGVIQNIQRLKGLFTKFGNQITEFQPDSIIFIDYGGFNLKAARIAKLKGFHTQFYIAPKVWAWNKGRIEDIKKWIDELYVIFPFELTMFQEKGIRTHYVGNPLQDAVAEFTPSKNFLTEQEITKPYVALLAGSRKQEIKSALPVFAQLALENPKTNFIVAGISDWKELYAHYPIRVLYDKTYDILSHAQVAIVTSGTATLETALFKIPQIVVYKTDWLFYSLAKLLVKIKFISLVNIILDKLAVPELIQVQFTSQHIQLKMHKLMQNDSVERISQLANYEDLANLIGPAGASKKTANLIVQAAQSAK
ncbi:lipid-A-disaccharide synthase [Aquirufa echingensis]|jgi:lipid-A-disaccharide synthase|uniref:Lipid-A-disaccharide synthase n=1 Tax=Aquirufa echingensis TaxID=3096516 RepID=A0ABW6D1M7_9BACT